MKVNWYENEEMYDDGVNLALRLSVHVSISAIFEMPAGFILFMSSCAYIYIVAVVVK